MATSKLPLHFLLPLVLVLSYVICTTNAVPVTRFGGLMHEIPRIDLHLLDQDNNMMKEQQMIRRSVNGRMAAELDDYPGWGANNRHTPRASTHGCSDC